MTNPFFSFLPVIPSINTEPELINHAHGIYLHDLVNSTVIHLNSRVFIRRATVPENGYEYSFWHLITHDEEIGGVNKRVFDPERTKRFGWIKPTIENHAAVGVAYWITKESNGRLRTYIHIVAMDYAVILEQKSNGYFLITAFHVHGWKKKQLDKRFNQRIK